MAYPTQTYAPAPPARELSDQADAAQVVGFATTLPCGVIPHQLAAHWPR